MEYREISFDEACQLYELHIPMEYSHRWAGQEAYMKWQAYPSEHEIEDPRSRSWQNPPPKWAIDSRQPDGRLDVRFRVLVE